MRHQCPPIKGSNLVLLFIQMISQIRPGITSKCRSIYHEIIVDSALDKPIALLIIFKTPCMLRRNIASRNPINEVNAEDVSRTPHFLMLSIWFGPRSSPVEVFLMFVCTDDLDKCSVSIASIVDTWYIYKRIIIRFHHMGVNMSKLISDLLQILIRLAILKILRTIHMHNIVICIVFPCNSRPLHCQDLVQVVLFVRRQISLDKDNIDREILRKPTIGIANDMPAGARPEW